MADRLFGILRHEHLQLGLRPLMIQERLPGAAEQPGEFGPRIRRAHVNDPNRLDPGLWRLNPEEVRGLATLYTAPELAFGRDNEVLIEWIGMGGDLNPSAAAGDHREDGTSGGDHPHVVL